MNNIKQKKEYLSDSEVIGFVTENSSDIKPSEQSLKLFLDKIHDSKPSPYVSKHSYSFFFQKSLVFAFVALLFLSGGIAYLNHKNTQSNNLSQTNLTSQNDVSDQSLSNDVTAIDAQLKSLDSDNQNIF